jgi:hypothetical protein
MVNKNKRRGIVPQSQFKNKRYQDTLNQIKVKQDAMLDKVNKETQMISTLKTKIKTRKSKQRNRVGSKMPIISRACSYLDTLLHPELDLGCRVSMGNVPSLVLHRSFTQTITTNAGGYAFMFWQPYWLFDTATNYSAFGTYTATGYNGTTSGTVGAPSVVLSAGQSNITPNTVSGFRLVSASVHIYSNLSYTNTSGSVWGAVKPIAGVVPINTGTYPALELQAMLLYSGVQNTFYNNKAISQQGNEGLRLVYYPATDEDWNGTYQVNNITNGAEVTETTFYAILQSGTGGSTFSVDCYVNYEVVPESGGILDGMQQLTKDASEPRKVLYAFHSDPNNITGTFSNAYVPPMGLSAQRRLF